MNADDLSGALHQDLRAASESSADVEPESAGETNWGPDEESLAIAAAAPATLDLESNPQDLSTRQLVIRAKTGDNDTLGVLMQQYQGFLLMLAHRYMDDRLRQRIDPCDIVQITCMEIQRDFPGFRGEHPGEFVAWIRNILRNNVSTAIARHVSAQKRSLNRETRVSGNSDDQSVAIWLGQMPGNTTSPSRKAMRTESVLKLMDALHQLPEQQAEALRLRYLEGLPLADIVQRMGKSDTAVAGLLKRGLKKLRTVMGDENWNLQS
ncbi:MAG: sigma-70 family RNA polymerase sigma factor [Planctomycetota bacterium]